MIILSPSWRADIGAFNADRLERLLNYPIGCDWIEAVVERPYGRPADMRTRRHSRFPFLVIWKPDLIARAIQARREGWRILIDTRIPRGGGDEYVVSIRRV